jgi:hypothetical protein
LFWCICRIVWCFCTTWCANYEVNLDDIVNEINYLYSRYRQCFDFQKGPNNSDIGEDTTHSVSVNKGDLLVGFCNTAWAANGACINVMYTPT